MNSEVEIFGATDDLFYVRHGRNYGFCPKTHLREMAKGNFPHTIEIDLNNLKGINPEVRQQNFLFKFLSGQVAPQILESDNITTDTINATTRTADKEEVKPMDGKQEPEPTENKQEAIQAPVPVENNPEEPQLKVQEQQPNVVPAVVEKTPEVPDSVEEDDEDFDDTEDDEEDEEDEDLEDVEINPIPKANDKPFVPPPMPATKAPENTETKQPELIAIPPSKDTESVTTENANKDEISNEIPPPPQPKQPSFTEEFLDFFDLGSDTPEPTPQTAEEDFKVLQQNVPEFVPMKQEVVEEAKISSAPIEAKNQTMPENIVEKVEEKAAVKVPEIVTVSDVVTEKVPKTMPKAVNEIPTKMPSDVIEQSKLVNNNIPDYKIDYYNDTESVQDNIPAVEVTEKPIVQNIELEKPIVQKVAQEIVTEKPTVQETVTEKPIVQEVIKEVVPEKPIALEAFKEVVTEKPIVQETVTEKPIVQEVVPEIVTEKSIVQEFVPEVVTEKPIVQETVTEKPNVQEVVTEQPAVQENFKPFEEPAIIVKVPEPVQDKPLSSSQEVFDTNKKPSFDTPKYDPLPTIDLPTTNENQQYNSVPAPAPDVQQNEDLQVKPKPIFNSDPLLKRFDRGGVGSVVELVNNKPESSEQVFKAPETETNKIVEIPVHEEVDEVQKEQTGGFFGRALKKLKIFSDDDDSEQHFHKKEVYHQHDHHDHSAENHNHLHTENAHDHSHNTNDHSHHNHDHSHNNNDHLHNNNDHTHEPIPSEDVKEQQQKPAGVVGEYFKNYNYNIL